MTSKESEHPLDTEATEWSDVLAGCRDGHRDAQRRLYELCYERVYRLMVRMAGVQDAADLTQQVFLQVFRKIHQFAGESKLETWLYRLATNEALQHLRKRKRRGTASLEYEPESDYIDDRRRKEAREVLEQALDRIDPTLRSIFMLREVEGLSYDQIAEVVDIPAGTVGSRLNRARRELRQKLTELGWES